MRPALFARSRVAKKISTAVFPTLVNPYTLVLGDSMAAKERFFLAINSATLTRDGVVNLGRITAPITNSGSNAFWGTPRVAIVNTTDTSFEVVGRNNFQDSTTTALSIHTKVADAYASRVPASNPTSAATTNQAISNGDILNLERISHLGVTPHLNSLMGGGMDVDANLGHPGVLATGTGATAMVAYAKTMCLAAGGTPLIFIRLGINDVKSNVTPNTIWAAYKVLLDSLTGLDGQGGNAVCVVRSVSSLGSVTANIGGLTYAQVNETVIGKCSTSNAGALSVDATLNTLQSVSQHTLNYQIWAYCNANPSKFLFVDDTSQSYDFTNHSTYDPTFPDTNGIGHMSAGDGTHYRVIGCRLQGAREYVALSPYVSYPAVVPRSSGDSTTPGGRTRVNNRGPWSSTAVVTSGFSTGGSASTLLPKGGTAGQPTGWTCGRSLGSGTIKLSVYDPGDGLGYVANAECTAVAANDSFNIWPFSSSGQAISNFGIDGSTFTNVDQNEYQFVFEVTWDGGTAAGLANIQATFQTNSSGLYGFTTNGESNDDGIGFPDSGTKTMATGWIQMSNASLTVLNAIITIRMGSITGVSCNVGVRCVGVLRR
jgi:hypothetical protein